MTSNPKIYIAGHRGMVGSAIVRELERKGHTNLVFRTHQELDLTNQLVVQNIFHQEKPEQVYLAAARVGGIYANNTFPAEFIYDNVMVQSNVIHQAFMHGVKKLLFLGSSCIYPRMASQPMSEDALLTGKLEPTNEPYAIAKIAGIKLCGFSWRNRIANFSFLLGLVVIQCANVVCSIKIISLDAQSVQICFLCVNSIVFLFVSHTQYKPNTLVLGIRLSQCL